MRRQSLNLLEKLVRNHNICELSQMLVLSQIYYYNLQIFKNLRTTAYAILINFQDSTLKGYFDKYCGRKVFHLPET